MRFPDPREEPVLVPLVAAYVGLSSFLGLTGFTFLPEAGYETVGYVVGMWVGYPLASLLFTVGSAATGLGALTLARDRRWAGAAGVGLAGTVLTYWWSFLVVSAGGGMGSGRGPAPSGALEALGFVVGWGVLGIGFAVSAPLAWARWGEPRLGSQGAAEGSEAP